MAADPATVLGARTNPSAFAGKSVGAITDHYADVIRRLDRKPVVMGHSFGGLITQKPAGLGLAVASVAIDPAPFVVCCRCRSPPLRASAPVLANPSSTAGR